jgi:hypothetical protein
MHFSLHAIPSPFLLARRHGGRPHTSSMTSSSHFTTTRLHRNSSVREHSIATAHAYKLCLNRRLVLDSLCLSSAFTATAAWERALNSDSTCLQTLCLNRRRVLASLRVSSVTASARDASPQNSSSRLSRYNKYANEDWAGKHTISCETRLAPAPTKRYHKPLESS